MSECARVLPKRSVATFRTLGSAASPQHLFALTHPAFTLISSLVVYLDSTAVLVSVAPSVTLRKAASVSGGTALTVAELVSGAAATATALGATASNGGGATAISPTGLGAAIRTLPLHRIHTAVGDVVPPGREFGPLLLSDAGILVVSLADAAAAATSHLWVSCAWQEAA